MEIEGIGGYTPEACRAAKILHNSYSLYKRMEKLYMTCVVEAVEIDRYVFKMEDLGRGLGTIILTQEGDLEKMGEEE
ncbi:MAG: hypothetical protein NUV73_01115, partial [Candidatus Daviesbacteria bacterium]|nr:hypothetical protein [Candidatus Daviesbacteria bacterium]